MDPLSDALNQITTALDTLAIRYAIGGSLASSARSQWRTTLDVDLIAAMRPEQAEAFIRSLPNEWYADPDAARDSVQVGRAFNLINKRTIQKVDVFPARQPFHRTQLDRATVLPLGEAQIPCRVVTAEDILLAKLRWYADGGCVSERQWNDITGLLAINPAMDQPYLDHWAAQLDVTALLDKARLDALR